jgi:hypothetical protein
MNIPILTALREATVDAESCVVEGIILGAGISENGTYYSPEVIANSVPVFKGVQCYADHPKPDEIERSVRDVVGQIEGTWADTNANGIRARIRLSRAHDWLLTMISEGLLGDLSINAMGKTKVARRDNRVVREVVEITRAHSVDFVARAAAGGRVERMIRESAMYGEGLRLLERVTSQEILEARPDIASALKNVVREELLLERDNGSSEIAKMEIELERRRIALKRESIASKLIDASRLPIKVREFLLMEALSLNTASEEAFGSAVAGLVERHRNYLAELHIDGVIRGMGSGKEAGADKSVTKRETRKLMGIG